MPASGNYRRSAEKPIDMMTAAPEKTETTGEKKPR
jgi:hypothetical protein